MDNRRIMDTLYYGKEIVMQEVYEFLKSAGTYYLATCEDGQPRVRPFGTVNIYDGKLYIQTGKSKSVSRQLRVEATAVEDVRREARVSMLEAYPELQSLYSPDDGNTEVWYLRNVTATFSSFTEPPKVLKF